MEKTLKQKLENLDSKVEEAITTLNNKSDLEKTKLVLEETTKQIEKFDGLAEGLSFISNPELKEDLLYLFNKGHDELNELPKRFRRKILNNLAQIPYSVKGKEQATSYILQSNTGEFDLILPLTEEQTKKGIGKKVYDSVKKILKKYDKNIMENKCKNSSIIFKSKINKTNVESLLVSLESTLSKEVYNPIKYEAIKTSNFYGSLIEGEKYCAKDLLEKYDVSWGSLYKAIGSLNLSKNYEKGVRSRKRIFLEEDITKLDSYFEKNPIKQKIRKKTVQDKSKYLKLKDVAERLELSSPAVGYRISKGDFGKVENYKGRKYISVQAVEEFKKNHIRMNMVYRKRR